MATLNIKAPDGKTLTIQVPPGTDPSQYEGMVDEVVQTYQQGIHDRSAAFDANRESVEPGVMGETEPPEMKALKAVNDVGAGFGTAQFGLGAAKGIYNGIKAIPEAVEGLPDALAEGVQKVKSWLPNPTLKGLGYGPTQTATEAGQKMATAAQDYAQTAQPEIGELVAGAKGPVDPNALVTRAAEGDMAEPIVPQNANTEVFNKPIAQGMANSAEQRLGLINEQWKQTGDAIKNTLNGLDETGESYDPAPLLKKVEGMFERDAEGKIMTTGVQGERNEAISEALDSMKDYAKGEPITFADSNRIKGMLQDSASYASKRFDEANEAYKSVANLIKEDIDGQASKVLAAHGGDIQNFQALRGAYSKLSSLRAAGTPLVGKEMLGPQTFGQQVMDKLKSPWVTGGGLAAGTAALVHKVLQ